MVAFGAPASVDKEFARNCSQLNIVRIVTDGDVVPNLTIRMGLSHVGNARTLRVRYDERGCGARRH